MNFGQAPLILLRPFASRFYRYPSFVGSGMVSLAHLPDPVKSDVVLLEARPKLKPLKIFRIQQGVFEVAHDDRHD